MENLLLSQILIGMNEEKFHALFPQLKLFEYETGKSLSYSQKINLVELSWLLDFKKKKLSLIECYSSRKCNADIFGLYLKVYEIIKEEMRHQLGKPTKSVENPDYASLDNPGNHSLMENSGLPCDRYLDLCFLEWDGKKHTAWINLAVVAYWNIELRVKILRK